MTEIRTPPMKLYNLDNEEYVIFGPQHTLSDIARWLAENRTDAEEMLHLIPTALENRDAS